MKIILIIYFFLTQYIWYVTISTYNQYKMLFRRYCTFSFFFFLLCLQNQCVFTLNSTCQFRLTTFQVLSSHIWVVATVLDSSVPEPALKNDHYQVSMKILWIRAFKRILEKGIWEMLFFMGKIWNFLKKYRLRSTLFGLVYFTKTSCISDCSKK